jgi:hypothetical protein
MGKMDIFKYVLDTATALGTWGAVVVALKLSRTTAKKTAEDAEAKAGLVAAHHLDHVHNIWLFARKLAVLLPPNRDIWASRADFIFPVTDIEQASLKVMDLGVIAQLLPLPNHCASRLGRSIGELTAQVEYMEAMKEVWSSELATAANTHAPRATNAEFGLKES